MLPRLVNDCRRQQFCGIEFADREALQPCLLTACKALKLCPPHVPQLDVDALRTTLAEEENRHEAEV
jgi:hypothetical protein